MTNYVSNVQLYCLTVIFFMDFYFVSNSACLKHYAYSSTVAVPHMHLPAHFHF